MKKLSLVGIVVLGLFLMVGNTFAASTTADLHVSATVSATAKLTVPANLTFPDGDPDSGAIAATEGPLSVTAKAKTSKNSSVTLTVLAATDLTSGTDTIAIPNLTWTVSGAGFVAGTMNKTTAQTVASWTDSGNRTGTMTYALANSWSYATGAYTATVTYTLTAP